MVLCWLWFPGAFGSHLLTLPAECCGHRLLQGSAPLAPALTQPLPPHGWGWVRAHLVRYTPAAAAAAAVSGSAPGGAGWQVAVVEEVLPAMPRGDVGLKEALAELGWLAPADGAAARCESRCTGVRMRAKQLRRRVTTAALNARCAFVLIGCLLPCSCCSSAAALASRRCHRCW